MDPFRLRSYPAREYRVMAQVRERMVREHNEQVERAQQGLPPQQPQPRRRKGKGAASVPSDW